MMKFMITTISQNNYLKVIILLKMILAINKIVTLYKIVWTIYNNWMISNLLLHLEIMKKMKKNEVTNKKMILKFKHNYIYQKKKFM